MDGLRHEGVQEEQEGGSEGCHAPSKKKVEEIKAHGNLG